MKVPIKLHLDYIRNTEKKAIVQMVNVFLVHLTVAVVKGVHFPCNKVYLNTRVLKHVYDKRPAEEYDFLLHHITDVVKYPDCIYRNKPGKRGEFCFVKETKNSRLFVSVEIAKTAVEDGKITHQCEVVTFYRINESYLRNYDLLWEWKDGGPSS